MALITALTLVTAIYVAYKTDLNITVKVILGLLLIPEAYFIYKWNAWKHFTVITLIYVLIGGFFVNVPSMVILHEMIRNLYFHVPMWFAMITLLTSSSIFSIRYLLKQRNIDDFKASEHARMGAMLGLLGYATGTVWAKFTWNGVPFMEPRLVSAAAAILLYFGYFGLRMSINDEQTKMRLSAIFNVFAYPTFIVLIYILPRMVENSLHPDLGGNDGFNDYDASTREGESINDNMKLVFYPAMIAWTLLAVWIANLRVRIKKLYYIVHELD